MKLAEMKSRGQCAKSCYQSGFLHSIHIILVLQNVYLTYSKDFWPNIIQIADIIFHPYHWQENQANLVTKGSSLNLGMLGLH